MGIHARAFGPQHAELATALEELAALAPRLSDPALDEASRNATVALALERVLAQRRTLLPGTTPRAALVARYLAVWIDQWADWLSPELTGIIAPILGLSPLRDWYSLAYWLR